MEVKPFLDQADDSPVSDSVLDELLHPRMLDAIEKCSDVKVEHPIHFPARDPDIQRVQRMMLAAPGPESIRKAQKVLLPDLVENCPDRVLYDFVFQRRNA